MPKRILILLVVSLLTVPSVQAKTKPLNGSLKDALVEYLYQYGKEVFYRGLDPQEASFVLQRALVLDCRHEGAKAFLNKLHAKYPKVSIRIWGCSPDDAAAQDKALADAASEAAVKRVSDGDQTSRVPVNSLRADRLNLNKDYEEAEKQMNDLENALHQKDQTISRYKAKLASKKPAEDRSNDVAYSTLANDQKDLIRIQQSNIDYLKSELAEVKKQLADGRGPSENEYVKAQIAVAASGLDAQEQRMVVETKDTETQDLRQRLIDLQEQLALVQKIVDDKNKTIEALERELKTE